MYAECRKCWPSESCGRPFRLSVIAILTTVSIVTSSPRTSSSPRRALSSCATLALPDSWVIITLTFYTYLHCVTVQFAILIKRTLIAFVLWWLIIDLCRLADVTALTNYTFSLSIRSGRELYRLRSHAMVPRSRTPRWWHAIRSGSWRLGYRSVVDYVP